jgi:hypothetical protein
MATPANIPLPAAPTVSGWLAQNIKQASQNDAPQNASSPK